MDYGIQLHMSKRDGKDKIEDSPKKACSCWFVRRNRLATSGANLYFFRVFCFVSFSSVFAFIKSVALRSVVLRYACCTDSHTQLVNSCLWTVSFCFLTFLWRCRFFRASCTIAVYLYGEYVVRFSYGWCDFCFCFQACDYKLDFEHQVLLFEI